MANLHCGRVERWWSVEDLGADICLTRAQRDALRPVLTHHLEEKEEYYATPRPTSEDERLSEDLLDDIRDKRSALMHTPAPDVDAILFKQEVFERTIDDDGFGFDDPGYFSHALLSGPYEDEARAVAYLDNLRLRRPDAPQLRLAPFNARAWLQAYEAAGGAATMQHETVELIVVFPAADNATAAALRDELAASPWKYRALFLFVRHRRSVGSDPYFWANGDRRSAPEDGAPRWPVARALRVSFAKKDGLPSPVVVAVDNTETLERLIAVSAEAG